ncbi:carboxylesterase/lipase family protein [Streptomyces lydicus]|uniref:carboxylesterase/lipase family protein n=1 Tax=Streptomyces lydicus TaxID=47763 RepID=UPI0036E8BA84
MAHTPLGALRGVDQGGSIVWRGVRYAEPPTGEHRFAPPRPVRPWNGTRAADEFGHAAWQVRMAPGQPVSPHQDEDCLFLNIWSRGKRGRKPVIVWIHGGAFVFGAGSDYDGTVLAERADVVVVTINYRLHAFGYLYQAERAGSGNAGLLDQIAALRWVRANISAFGGDPANITVMGESAGAMSIGALLGAPAARGLFHRAIVQSGGARPIFSETKTATDVTNALLRILGISPSHSNRLLSVSASELNQAAEKLASDSDMGGEHFHPVVDGDVLYTHPLRSLSGDVDLIVGICRDEANQLTKLLPQFGTGLKENTRQLVGSRLWAHLNTVYQRTTSAGRDAEMDLLSASFVGMPSVWLGAAARSAGSRVWHYRFDYPDAGPAGPVHASDLMFTFGKVDPKQLKDGADVKVAQRLADTMVDAFTSFARTGCPEVDGRDWPALAHGNGRTMLFEPKFTLAASLLPTQQVAAWRHVDPTLF